jgi:hypothetical protein
MNNSHLIPMPNQADRFLLEIEKKGRTSVRGPDKQSTVRYGLNRRDLRWAKGIEAPNFAL